MLGGFEDCWTWGLVGGSKSLACSWRVVYYPGTLCNCLRPNHHKVISLPSLPIITFLLCLKPWELSQNKPFLLELAVLGYFVTVVKN